jgi:hypothetical protein
MKNLSPLKFFFSHANQKKRDLVMLSAGKKQLLLNLAAVFLWSGFAVAVFVRVILAGGTHRSAYDCFYFAGEHFLQQLPLYSGEAHGYQYYPGFAAAMTVLTLLPFAVGALVWTAVNFAVFLFGAWRFAGQFIPPAQRAWFFIALLPVAFEGLLNQQSNPLLGGAILWGAALVAQHKWWRGVAALTVAGWIKVAPLCYALLVGAIFPRRLWWRGAVVLALAVVGVFLCQNYEYVVAGYRDWLDMCQRLSNDRHDYRDMFTLYEYLTTGAITRGAPVAEMTGYHLAQLLAAGLALAFTLKVYYRDRWDAGRAVLFAYAAGAWWLMSFGPSTEIPTLTLMAAGPAWALVAAREMKNAGGGRFG